MKVIIYLISLVMWSFQSTSAEVKAFALANKIAFSNYEIKEMLNEYGVYSQMNPDSKEQLDKALEKPSVFYFNFSKDKFQISVNGHAEKFSVSVKDNLFDLSSSRVKATIGKGETFESIYAKLKKTKISYHLKNIFIPSAYGQDYSGTNDLLHPLNFNSPINPLNPDNQTSSGGASLSAAEVGLIAGGSVAIAGSTMLAAASLPFATVLMLIAALVAACAAIGFVIGDAFDGFNSTKAIKNKLLGFKEKKLLERALSICNNQLSTHKNIPKAEIEKIRTQIIGDSNREIKNQLSVCLESNESKSVSVNQDHKPDVKKNQYEAQPKKLIQGLAK